MATHEPRASRLHGKTSFSRKRNHDFAEDNQNKRSTKKLKQESPSLESLLVGLASSLYRQNPLHPIFGPAAHGIIRLPYTARRVNGQCWKNTMVKIARNITKQMGKMWTIEGCWLSTVSQIQIISPSGPHSVRVYASITIVRLLVFFANPTDANWEKLTCNQPTQYPFDHRCHRGHERHNGSVGYINGVGHGVLTTREINEGRKKCKYRCLAMCQGHGIGGKCIYTDRETGQIQPCRMVEDLLPKCKCVKRCY
ncbi:hypothetical protein ACMFMG_007963 [Clarireedia jacksonii]